MHVMPIHLIVIGAGLAGLSAALATKLAKAEHQVTVLEATKELAEVGVRVHDCSTRFALTPRRSLICVNF